MKSLNPALIVAAIVLNACSGWSKVSTGSVSTPARPELLRVVRNDGSTQILDSAGVAGDTLIGYVRVPLDTQTATGLEWSRGYRLSRVSVPLSTIRSVEHRELSVDTTVGAVLGTIVGVFLAGLVTFLIAGSS